MTTRTEALEEAYASADVETELIDTLELRHPALVDPDTELPDPIRVAYGTRDWSLKLEADAALHAGQIVTFRAALFGIDLPDSSDAVPSCKIWVDAVSRDVVAALEQIVTIRAPIEVTYRQFIAPAEGAPAPEPGWVIGGLRLRVVPIDMQRMSGELSFRSLGQKAFPSGVYTRALFPGLYR